MPREQHRGARRAPRTSDSRASNCSERLRTKRGQSPAPGMSSCRLESIWQPLQTPSAKVSAPGEEALQLAPGPGVEEDRLGPALAGAQHVAVGEAAAGGQAAEAVERGAPLEQVAHVHVDRLEAGAVEGGGHLDLPVHALLAQDGHPRPGAAGHEGRGQVLVRVEGERGRGGRDRRGRSGRPAPRRRRSGRRAAPAWRGWSRTRCRAARRGRRRGAARPPAGSTTRSPVTGRPIRWTQPPSPCRLERRRDPRRRPRPRTCSTAPSSSAKRTARGSPASGASSTSRPAPPAKAISSSVTSRPPSERSW